MGSGAYVCEFSEIIFCALPTIVFHASIYLYVNCSTFKHIFIFVHIYLYALKVESVLQPFLSDLLILFSNQCFALNTALVIPKQRLLLKRSCPQKIK